MRRLITLCLLVLALAGKGVCKEAFNVGYLGNTYTASSLSNFYALELICAEYTATSTAYEIKAVFFDENDPGAASAINSTSNLLAVIGDIRDKQKDIVSNAQGKLFISTSQEFIDLTRLGLPNAIRIAPSGAELVRALCRIQVKVLKKNRFAVLFSGASGDYQKIAEAYEQTALANKCQVVYSRVVEPDRKDLFPLVNMVREKKAHTLFYAGPLDQAAAVAQLSRELGSGAQFSTMDINATMEYVKKSKDASSGSQFALKSPVILSSIKKLRPLLQKVGAKHKSFDASLPYIYDASQLLFSGLEAGKKSRDEMRDYIKALKTKGATGEIRFTDSGERLGANVYLYIVQKKEFFYRKLGYEESKAYSEAR